MEELRSRVDLLGLGGKGWTDQEIEEGRLESREVKGKARRNGRVGKIDQKLMKVQSR
jgi:hypothetical protein